MKDSDSPNIANPSEYVSTSSSPFLVNESPFKIFELKLLSFHVVIPSLDQSWVPEESVASNHARPSCSVKPRTEPGEKSTVGEI